MSGPLSALSLHDRELRLVILVPLMCSFVLCLASSIFLLRGVQKGVWTEPELAGLRRWIGHPAWIGVIAMSFLGTFVSCFHHGIGFTILLMSPGQAVIQLKNIVRIKTVEQRSIFGL